MLKKLSVLSGLLAASVLSLAGNSPAANIEGTKHDLSNPGQSQICIFCHTPHNARFTLGLWNRLGVSDMTVFKFYSSSSMDTRPVGTAPSPRSILCLTCHDAATGSGKADRISAVSSANTHGLGRGSTGVSTAAYCGKCHPNGSDPVSIEFQIGANLTDDHPISIPYPTAAQDPRFNAPPDTQNGWGDVKLFNGLLECASCHDPHDAANGMFLRKSNSQSALCLTCHQK